MVRLAASLQGWISDVLDEHAEKIYRFKGIVNVHNEDKRLAFHGVHSCFDCDFLSEWKADEKRISKVGSLRVGTLTFMVGV